LNFKDLKFEIGESVIKAWFEILDLRIEIRDFEAGISASNLTFKI